MEAYQTDFVSPDYVDVCARGGRQLRPAPDRRAGARAVGRLEPGGQFFGRTLFPDALDTLRWLREHGFKLGSVTDAPLAGRASMRSSRNTD